MRVDPAVWNLHVSCDVQRIYGTDEFDVHWFHKNNENEIIDLGQVEVQETPNRERIKLGTQWINTPFDESMLGEYWCQVIVTSTQPNTYLGTSDILVIRDPQDYDTLSTCSGINTEATSKCADGMQSSFSVSPSSSFSSSQQCTNPTTTEGMQLSSIESRSSSSQHLTSSKENIPSSSRLIPCETNPTTTAKLTTTSATENMSSNIKTYSINTPSNSPVKSNGNGLASYYIVIIIVFIIIIMLGILLVISCCLVILCIKRKKQIEDTTYYGKLIITLCIIYHFHVYGIYTVTSEDIKSPDPCNQ